MPATAAIDNETLDHLLSVVDDGNQYIGAGHDSKASRLRQLAALRLRPGTILARTAL
jgi:hypothetical protein